MRGEKRRVSFTADAQIDPESERITEQDIEAGVLEENLRVAISAAFCVIYQSSASNAWCYTAHIVVFGKRDGTEWNSSLGDVPPANIRMTVVPEFTLMA